MTPGACISIDFEKRQKCCPFQKLKISLFSRTSSAQTIVSQNHSKIFYSLIPDDISEDEEYSNVVSEAKHLRGDESSSREPSPLKESLMNKFSKFSSSKSQNPSINNCDPEFKSGIVEEDPDGCQVSLHIFFRRNNCFTYCKIVQY